MVGTPLINHQWLSSTNITEHRQSFAINNHHLSPLTVISLPLTVISLPLTVIYNHSTSFNRHLTIICHTTLQHDLTLSTPWESTKESYQNGKDMQGWHSMALTKLEVPYHISAKLPNTQGQHGHARPNWLFWLTANSWIIRKHCLFGKQSGRTQITLSNSNGFGQPRIITIILLNYQSGDLMGNQPPHNYQKVYRNSPWNFSIGGSRECGWKIRGLV